MIGGATGQIGDPKDSGERDLKPLAEIEHNKRCLSEQYEQVFGQTSKGGLKLTMVDNLDWFKDIGYIDFIRQIGKEFSMTQLLDREFVKSRIGEGGSGISYAEFSYSLIQGYDFLHLYRTYGVDLQVCGADQFGNCTSGMHLIRKLEDGKANVWSMPLVIDKVSGKKFGKSEGNAIWLDKNKTSVFNFYQFWLNVDDIQVEEFLKIYTLIMPEELEELMAGHAVDPTQRLAQKYLAREVTRIVHGDADAANVVKITTVLFDGGKVAELSAEEIELLAREIPSAKLGRDIVDVLVSSGEASSKGEARRLIASGAISVDGVKVAAPTFVLEQPAIVKKGKNRFILVM